MSTQLRLRIAATRIRAPINIFRRVACGTRSDGISLMRHGYPGRVPLPTATLPSRRERVVTRGSHGHLFILEGGTR